MAMEDVAAATRALALRRAEGSESASSASMSYAQFLRALITVACRCAGALLARRSGGGGGGGGDVAAEPYGLAAAALAPTLPGVAASPLGATTPLLAGLVPSIRSHTDAVATVRALLSRTTVHYSGLADGVGGDKGGGNGELEAIGVATSGRAGSVLVATVNEPACAALMLLLEAAVIPCARAWSVVAWRAELAALREASPHSREAGDAPSTTAAELLGPFTPGLRLLYSYYAVPVVAPLSGRQSHPRAGAGYRRWRRHEPAVARRRWGLAAARGR